MPLLSTPAWQFVRSDGNVEAFAEAYFYLGGTTTPVAVYQDEQLEDEHPWPVVANDKGFFPSMYVRPEGTVRIKVVAQDGDLENPLLDVEYDAGVFAPVDVSYKLDKQLPATSPVVGAPSYSANVILDNPHIPERFVLPNENLANILAGTADGTGVWRRMVEATQQSQKDTMKPIDLGACRLRVDEPAIVSTGNYQGGGISVLGGGGRVSRLIASPDNREGILHITRSFNMETVTVKGVAFCSPLLQRTANAVLNGKNPSYATAPIDINSGVALFVDGPLPGDGIYGVEDMTAVRILNNMWCGIGADQDLTIYNGIWAKALHVKGAWFSEFIGNHFVGMFEADCAAGFVNGNNVRAMHLEHCYAPDVILNKFNGVWDANLDLEGKEAGGGATLGDMFGVRWEGGRISKNIFGGLAKDAVLISHEYPAGSLQSPGFQIDNNHVNFRRNGITINGHRQIQSMGNEFYARETPNPFGEPLPAAYKLRDVGDFDSTNDCFLELGWNTDAANTFVCYRLLDKVQGFKAHGPRFNCNGTGVHIGPPVVIATGDVATYSRSVQVLDAVEGGRRAFDLWGDTPFRKYTDLSGLRIVYWEGTDQESNQDHKRIISNASEPTNAIVSPSLDLDTDNQDYATRSNPQLGSMGLRYRDSAGAFKSAFFVTSMVDSNVAGADMATTKFYTRRAGGDVLWFTFDGPTGWMVGGSNRALKIGRASTAWGANPPATQPSITGSRTTDIPTILFQVLEALGATQGTGVWTNNTTA